MNEPNNNLEDIAQCVTGAEAVSFDGVDDIMADCPIQPLGTANGIYAFISPEGALREMAARDFNFNNLNSLFAGNLAWLQEKFPETGRQNSQRDDFNVRATTTALIRSCHQRGYFSGNETHLRRHGVWRYGSKAILHAGDAFYYEGQWHRAGQKLGEAVYVACAPVERPSFDEPLGTFEARRLRRNMNVWAYEEAGDPDLIFGWMGAAMLGGFPNWRVHAFIIGERGSGKSTLGEYITDCLGPQAEFTNNFTEPGVRQSLQNEARAIYLDEAGIDSDTQRKRMSEAIRLFRQVSGGKGARTVRGSSGGTAISTTVTGCVLMTAVYPPPLDNQDRSRILEISLKIPVQTETSKIDIESFRAEARRYSAGLRARAFMRIDHFQAAFHLFNKILVAKGCDGRQSDMFATLFAGRSILYDDDVPTSEKATEFVEMYDERLQTMLVEDSEQNDGHKCLNRLYDFMPDFYRHSERMTMGQIIAAHVEGTSEGNVLKAYGLRLARRSKTEPFSLFIPNGNNNLEDIYEKTPWVGGGWRKSLLRLPGVVRSEKTVRVGLESRRGVWIPYELLPKSFDSGAEPIDNPPAPP
jgi:hypothetical protein